MESVFCPPEVIAGSDHSERPALFEIAGRVLLFEEDGAPLELLGGYYCKPIPRDAGITPAARIRIRVTEFPHEIATAFQKFEIFGGGVCYTDGSTCIFDYEKGRVIANGAEPQQIEVLAKGALDLSRFEDLQVMNCAISTALRRSRLFELHSAAVVEPDSRRGVLFAGVSGSGKSTLTLQLVASGWQYLTDDVLFLKELDGVFKAYPLRRAFAVTRATVEAGGSRVRQAFANGDWTNGSKKVFMPHDLFPDAFLSDCEPRVIFFPAITDERDSVVKALTTRETMIQLIKLCPWSCYDPVTSLEHVAALAALARQCRGFSFGAGKDLLDDPARASALVQERMASVY